MTTVGTESRELKKARIILLPGKLTWFNAKATNSANGVVNKIALSETEKESNTIDHNSASPDNSNCNAC